MRYVVLSNRFLFDLNDAELVRVSALATELEEKESELEQTMADFQTRLDTAEGQISDLESGHGRMSRG
jgi:hypothetical protein